MSRVRTLLAVLAFAASGASCFSPLPPSAANPEKLHLAASSGDHAAVDAALKSGSKIDQVDGHGKTPLSYAAAGGNAAMVTYLLDKGADPNHVSEDGDTPLLVAARKGNDATVELLVQRGARIDTYGEDGFTALAIATKRADRKSFDLLLQLGARPNVSLANCDTALIASIPLKDLYYFDRLIGAGADPNLPGRAGNTPLIVAAYANKLEIAEKLLAKGARVNDANAGGYCALHFAVGVKGVDPALVRLLVEKGADVNRKARDGFPPVKFACQSGSAEMAMYLFEKGAIPAFEDTTPEGVEMNGTMQHFLGDYYLVQDQREKARTAYAAAQSYYKKMIELCKGDVTKLMWVEIGMGVNAEMAGMVQSSIASHQAQQQSRTFAQFGAMKHAEQTRTGFAGYSAYMAKYHQTYVPTYQGVNMASLSPPSGLVPLEEKKAFAYAKVKQFEERSAVITRVLECFDKYPGGGADLHACVNTATKAPVADTKKK
jgi:ankyrin repeat protein